MSFAEVKHQAEAQRRLQRFIARERTPHAYIFQGPDGVGKERLAREFARQLLCANPVRREFPATEAASVGVESLSDGCGQCEDCRLVSADSHPDLQLIYRQLNRHHPDATVRGRTGLELGIDVIRHFLISAVGLTPSRGRARVFLIREAHLMNVEAQNALLKTLEEPPGPSYLILLTSAVDRLLATTLSRCQLVRFGALPVEFVHQLLTKATPALSPAEAEWYAALAGGSIGRAMECVGQDLHRINETVIESLTRPSTAGRSIVDAWDDLRDRLAARLRKTDSEITDTEATRRALKTIFLLTATWQADLLRAASGLPPLVNRARTVEASRQAGATGVGPIIRRMARIVYAERALDHNVHPQLCVEVLSAELAA